MLTDIELCYYFILCYLARIFDAPQCAFAEEISGVPNLARLIFSYALEEPASVYPYSGNWGPLQIISFYLVTVSLRRFHELFHFFVDFVHSQLEGGVRDVIARSICPQ